ncbi:hypothetical protein PsYK624_125810 [Phanerochaete sordida]|uniref:Uncharacterized protein n=1 Tax=Phanerochaete sordida TaxID=48140 RepID=A0A9P3LII0_9APHY|nr:hypothetical protein PsYK624_125810 [Phanerochaete sordida]
MSMKALQSFDGSCSVAPGCQAWEPSSPSLSHYDVSAFASGGLGRAHRRISVANRFATDHKIPTRTENASVYAYIYALGLAGPLEQRSIKGFAAPYLPSRCSIMCPPMPLRTTAPLANLQHHSTLLSVALRTL